MGRGVSRFMQNGTQLPGEVASNAVRPSRITRASFSAAAEAPRRRHPLESSFLLLYRPRKGGPPFYIYIYIRVCVRTYVSMERSSAASSSFSFYSFPLEEGGFVGFGEDASLDWNFRGVVDSRGAWRRKISYATF